MITRTILKSDTKTGKLVKISEKVISFSPEEQKIVDFWNSLELNCYHV